MSSATIKLTDNDDGSTDVEVSISDRNAESPSVILGTYLSQNWDTIVMACKRHLILRTAAIDGLPGAPNADSFKPDLKLVEPAPKLLNASGTGTISSEE